MPINIGNNDLLSLVTNSVIVAMLFNRETDSHEFSTGRTPTCNDFETKMTAVHRQCP